MFQLKEDLCKLHFMLTFSFINFLEDHVDLGRERLNYNSCDEIVSGPRQNINSLKDSPKYSQTGQFITEKLNSISILCNEWEKCLCISSFKFYCSCRLCLLGFLTVTTIAISLLLSYHSWCHFSCQFFSYLTIFGAIFDAIYFLLPLSPMSDPQSKANQAGHWPVQNLFPYLWLSQTLSSLSPGGHFMTIARSCIEVVGGKGLSILAWKNWPVAR